jgi:hypothetical protein
MPPAAAKSLTSRALATIDETKHPLRLVFTAAGLEVLREMMANPKLADPVKFARIRRELGIDPSLDCGSADCLNGQQLTLKDFWTD